MFTKLASLAVTAAVAATPVVLSTVAPADAAPTTHVAAATTYGKVTAKHLLTRSELVFPNRLWSSVSNVSAEPQATGAMCQLHPSGKATSMASGVWYGKPRYQYGTVEARGYASVAQAQAAMRSMNGQLTRCSNPNPGARTKASKMTLSIRTADAEIGSVYKVTDGSLSFYEFVGAVRVGNRVETVTVTSTKRFPGDVSKFAYQMSLAAKKLHNR